MALDLSVKKYYTFPELVSRLQCSAQDLHHFLTEGEITPSFFLVGGNYRLYQLQPHDDYDKSGNTYPSEVQDVCDPADGSVREWRYGFHFLVFPHRTNMNQCEFRFAAKEPFGHDCGDILYGLESYMDIDGVFNSGVVMAGELERFLASKSLPRTHSIPTEISIDSEIDPCDLPAELDAAKMAFRAVSNGYGDPNTTPRNRLIGYLESQYPEFKPEQVKRIATVANPDKSTGRKKIRKE